MSEIKIIEGIIIDEPENVERAVYDLCGAKVSIELIKKFICREKYTKFYLDRKMNSSTELGMFQEYLWLDTGFRDALNNSIMICLHNSYRGYVGHFTGTIQELYGRIKLFNSKNKREIEKNYFRFVSKYKKLIEQRDITYITDPMQYAVTVLNNVNSEDTVFAKAFQKIENLESILENDTEESVEVISDNEQYEEEFSENQKEITVGILYDQIEEMQGYITELLSLIEKNEKKSEKEIKTLKIKNEEYKRALINIRTFMSSEEEKEERATDLVSGHNLLENNEKILVLGNTDIRVTEMRAIARDYFGFEKVDFEFITDYAKIKNAGNRIHASERFAAVIFGNCPHKVASIGGYSSIIEEFKNKQNCPLSIDARTESGNLKITKQSFKKALSQVYMELRKDKIAG